MNLSEIKKESKQMEEICKYLRVETLTGFDDLKKLKGSGNITEADLDYELARDRKAGIILKSIVIEIGIGKIKNKKINIGNE